MADDDYKNVRISFWSFIKTTYAGYGVKYEGLDFDTAEYDEWIEPHILNGTGLPHRADQRFESWLFQIDHYSRGGPNGQTPVSIWDMVGVTKTAFDQQVIALKDWDATGDPVVGYLKCGPLSVAIIPTEDEALRRVAATVTATLNE